MPIHCSPSWRVEEPVTQGILDEITNGVNDNLHESLTDFLFDGHADRIMYWVIMMLRQEPTSESREQRIQNVVTEIPDCPHVGNFQEVSRYVLAHLREEPFPPETTPPRPE